MKLGKIKASELDRNLKASIHKTGKIGFTIEASDKMQLTTDSYIEIFSNLDDEKDENLYVNVIQEKDKDAFQVFLAGDYFYINAKSLLESLGIDYKKDLNYYYKIVKDTIDGIEMFVFKKTEKERRNKKEAND
jgi:hypothetical protein